MKTPRSVAELEAALEGFPPETPKLLMELAHRHELDGEPLQAGEVLLQISDILEANEQPERAKDILDRIADMFPTRTDVALRRAQVALALGDHEDALKHVADAMDRAAASGNKEEMIVASEVYAGCFPREPMVRYSHVLVLLTVGEQEKAAEAFAVATRLLATSFPHISPPTFDEASIEAVVHQLRTANRPQN